MMRKNLSRNPPPKPMQGSDDGTMIHIRSVVPRVGTDVKRSYEKYKENNKNTK